MQLSEYLIYRIKEKSSSSFHDFMEMALHHPEVGYYNATKTKIGADGDFYTCPCISVNFGVVIGRQIEEM